jgi:hypothetical protein
VLLPGPKPKRPRKKESRSRHQREWSEQFYLYRHVRQLEGSYPVLKLLHSIPNAGGYDRRDSGDKVKVRVINALRTGVRPGWPDNELPVARQGYTGLAIELKAPGNLEDVKPTQDDIHKLLRAEGWHVTIRDRWQHAWNDVREYLNLPLQLHIAFVPPTLEEVRRQGHGEGKTRVINAALGVP